MSFMGIEVSPVQHLNAIDRIVRVTELMLRCAIVGFGVLTSLLIGTDSQVKEIFSVQKKANFRDMKALGFLVGANGLVAVYSIGQVLRCVLCMVRGHVHVLFSNNKPLAWAIFSCDQVMTYLTIAAVSTAAQSAMFAKLGQAELRWMGICDIYGMFCNQVAEGLGSAVIASLCMIFISGMSAFGVFRLYEGNKRKSHGQQW